MMTWKLSGKTWLVLLMEKAVPALCGSSRGEALIPGYRHHPACRNYESPVGPAHKLQFAHDTEDHYFGQNRGVHDMLGVTGACLLVKKTIFEKAGRV